MHGLACLPSFGPGSRRALDECEARPRGQAHAWKHDACGLCWDSYGSGPGLLQACAMNLAWP